VLVGADTAGGTHEFVHHLHVRRLQYSVGFQVTAARPVPVARGGKRSYGAKRLFVIHSALTIVWSAPRWGSERFGSGCGCGLRAPRRRYRAKRRSRHHLPSAIGAQRSGALLFLG
jgi:hypothetical protein